MAEENKTIESTETNEVETSSKEIEKLKRLLSDANSEAAKYKKELRAKQTADEQAEADRNEKFASMEAELNELRRSKSIDKFTSDFMDLGFDKENAIKVATAHVDGDTDTVFSNLKTQIEALKKASLTEAMNKQGGLTNGKAPASTKTYTKEDISTMSADEINAHWDEIQKSLKGE